MPASNGSRATRRAPALAWLAWAALCGCGSERAQDAPLNVVLISLDTCRADRLSCYGAARPTPRLDALAAESVRFEDCLSQSCLTAPSHLSMLTGQYVHRHGLSENGDVRVPGAPLASVLRAHGYRTAAFTGHGLLQAKYGHGTGFDVFESWDGPAPESWPFWRDVADVLPGALAWLDANQAHPFFLLVHGYDPHQPYWPPEPWRTQYAGWYQGELDPLHLRAPEYKALIHQKRYGPDEERYVADLYDGEVASADTILGGFLDELRARGLLERSIVVFTSDHGESFGDGDIVGHGAMLEQVLHVPLLIRFPGGRWAGTRAEPVQTIDLMPTLLEALGVEAPAGVSGTSLMGLIRGGPAPFEEQRLRVAQVKSHFAVRYGERWKLFFALDGERVSRQSLYDLQTDPLEEHDLYGTPEGRGRFNRLLGTFLRWRASTEPDDERYGGREEASAAEEDVELLRDLGYAESKGQ